MGRSISDLKLQFQQAITLPLDREISPYNNLLKTQALLDLASKCNLQAEQQISSKDWYLSRVSLTVF